MTYEESLGWLYSTQQFGIKLGLDNIRSLLKALGDPHEHLSFLHVAGTNGKGSVCAMLDAVLRAADHKTGLYTSPHLIDFRERIRVDGRKIPREAAARGLENLRRLAADLGSFAHILRVCDRPCFAAFRRIGLRVRCSGDRNGRTIGRNKRGDTSCRGDHSHCFGSHALARENSARGRTGKSGHHQAERPGRQRATGSDRCGSDRQACGRAGVLLDVCRSSVGRR